MPMEITLNDSREGSDPERKRYADGSAHRGSGDWVAPSDNQAEIFKSAYGDGVTDFAIYERGNAEYDGKRNSATVLDGSSGTSRNDTGDIKDLFPSNLPSQYKALVSQIETSRQPNYPFILRRVYEAGHLKAFLQYLDRRSEAQDAETEQICAEHTATLTKTAKDIMSISQGVESIHGGLKSLGKVQAQELEGASSAAKLVATYGNALIHTATLMERISILKPVVRIVGEAQICMEKDQLVKALRKLHDAWERVRTLPHHIRLVKSLADNIPFMKDQIIAQAKRGVTISLESMRNANLRVGFLTLKTICETHRISVAPYFVENGQLQSSRYPEEVKYLEDKTWLVDNAIQIKHLLVFRHIMLTFEVEDLLETELRAYCENYELQRKHQVGQMVQSPNQMRSVDDIRKYIQEITGIFALELHVNKTITGLTSPDFCSTLWNEAVPTIATVIRSSFPFLTDEERCRRMRDLVGLFVTTMESLHCETGQINVVLDSIRDHYGEILLRGLENQMSRVLESDALIAVSITSREEEERFLCGFPFRFEEAPNNKTLPKHFPFSTSVPKFYTLMKDYIASFVQFSREGSIGQADGEDKVRASILNLLSQKLRACMGGVVERGALTIEQLVQLYINCKYLEFSCQYLEVFLIDLMKSSSATSTRPESSLGQTPERSRSGSAFPQLYDHSSIFRDIRSQIEQQIYTSLGFALEVMMEETRFDSAAAEVLNKPSELWHRIIRYLEPVFESVRKLPYNVCQTAGMTACKQIAAELQVSFAEKSTMVTIEGTQQLKNDLAAYEDFLTKQASYTDSSMLLLAFTSLNQLTDLLLLWDWNTYFHEYGRKDAKYDRVQPQLVLQILLKMKETDRKKSSVFQNLRKNERDKKKLLDNIIVQLREILNERLS